ncbi:hypothetical protein EC968_007287 [Mortierella alpina]|nr:hypothetical protein EC968_007287 [Mortierella alpina]
MLLDCETPSTGTKPLLILGVLPDCPPNDPSTEWRLADAHNNVIPDFSHVGYREGHVKIPVFPVKKTVEPIPGGSDDDTERIQDAINEVGALPLLSLGRDDIKVRGAVLLKKGKYRLAGALFINKSGVVLRGEGPGPSLGIEPRMNQYEPSRRPSTRTRPEVYISIGTTTLPVKDTRGFGSGDKIVLELPNSKDWAYGTGNDHERNKTETSAFYLERTIRAVDKNARTFKVDIPMVMNVDPKDHPLGAKISHVIYETDMISDVGVENLRLSKDGGNEQPISKYAVKIDNTIHGWLSDVVAQGFTLGIEASSWSRFITIQNSRVECRRDERAAQGREGAGFVLNGQMSLINNCATVDGFYDFTSDGPTSGPNVFVDSHSKNSLNFTGPRKRWVIGSLYDNIVLSMSFTTVKQSADIAPFEAPQAQQIGSLVFKIFQRRIREKV